MPRKKEVIGLTTGERMKARRKEIGISAEKVASALGVSPATIYRYENGSIDKVPVDALEPIARVLETTPAFLMGWEEDASPKENNSSAPALEEDEDLIFIGRKARDMTPEQRKRLSGIIKLMFEEDP